MWASADPNTDAYASLEATIELGRNWGIPTYLVPFWHDEGNFYCFDTRNRSEFDESPIVFWEHDAPSDNPGVTHESFVDWLKERLEQAWKRRQSKQP